MKVLTQDSVEFKELLEALVNELVDAQCHFRLHQKLVDSLSSEEYGMVYTQSAAFWSLTLTAHIDAALLRLCKAYDQYDRQPTLTLGNLIETISANLHLFEEPNFRERLKNNAFVDSLAKEPRVPDKNQLRKDCGTVSEDHPLVKKLIAWRNKVYAHTSADVVLNRKEFNDSNRLSVEDIKALLENGLSIVNRYLGLFAASHYATGMVRQDDYLWLLKTAREALEAHRTRIDAEFKELSAKCGNQSS